MRHLIFNKFDLFYLKAFTLLFLFSYIISTTIAKSQKLTNLNKNQTKTIFNNNSINESLNKFNLNLNQDNKRGIWKVEESKEISFSNDNTFNVEMLSREDIENGPLFKLTIRQKNKNNQLIWESQVKDGRHFTELEILKTKRNAIIVGVYNMGGAHAYDDCFTVFLNELGEVKPIIVNEFNYIEKSLNSLVINESYRIIVYDIRGENIERKIIKRENMGAENSIKAYFKLYNNFFIAENKIIRINIGETISFVPKDQVTSKIFNSGKINIYVNSSDYYPMLGEVTRIKSGNSITFDSEGTFYCILSIISPDGIESSETTFMIKVNK